MDPMEIRRFLHAGSIFALTRTLAGKAGPENRNFDNKQLAREILKTGPVLGNLFHEFTPYLLVF